MAMLFAVSGCCRAAALASVARPPVVAAPSWRVTGGLVVAVVVASVVDEGGRWCLAVRKQLLSQCLVGAVVVSSCWGSGRCSQLAVAHGLCQDAHLLAVVRDQCARLVAARCLRSRPVVAAVAVGGPVAGAGLAETGRLVAVFVGGRWSGQRGLWLGSRRFVSSVVEEPVRRLHVSPWVSLCSLLFGGRCVIALSR